MARYRVLQGIDYPPNKRAEVGDIVEDIPAQSVKWLLDSGIIEDTDKPTKKTEKPVVEQTKAEPVAEVVEEPVVKEGLDADATDVDDESFVQDGAPSPLEEK
jgi:hypothetical protein